MKKTVKIISIILLLSFVFVLVTNSYAVVDGKTIRTVISFKRLTPREVVQKARIPINANDIILGTDKTPCRVIRVIRSISVQLNIDGKSILLNTTKRRVGDILQEAGIKIGTKDTVKPSLSSTVGNGDKITIQTYRTVIKTVKIIIPYKTVYQENDKLAENKVIKFRDGVNGILEKKFLVSYLGDKKVEQKEISERVVTPAVSAVYMVGEAHFNYHYIKKLRVVATAYSPRVIETDGNPWRTATGMRSGFGIVAVDPKVIPLGTLMYVQGYGYAVAGDTGSLIKGNKIDVFFYSTQDAYNWGRRTVTVYILPGKWNFPKELSY